jgi:16S rRNA processing protein RimM
MRNLKMSKYLETVKIVGVFGLRGELKVLSDSSTNLFIKDNYLYLGKKETKLTKVKISSSRFHKGMYLVTIDDLFDINLVEKYVGCNFYIDREELDDLEDNEYYFTDLIGLKVINQHNEELGTVIDVLDLPTSAVLEIKLKNDKKCMIPFVKEYIIDVTDEVILINEIEGFR